MLTHLILAVLIFVHIFFFIALMRKNFAVIDIGWGLGFIVIGLVAYFHHPLSIKNALLMIIVTIWGLRLGSYILMRSRGKGEDPRYTKFREAWKPHSNLQAYFKVFLFQGFLMLIVSLPVTLAMAQERQTISILNWVGVIIWVMGFVLEICADHYLTWWKSRPQNKGQICTSGPWKLCRFPNYFGEVLLWYGIYFASFELQNFWTIIGPVAINFFIYKVTGVPLLEEKYQAREDYREYSKKTPKFIPFTRP
jgi:steroid 5-alpha reductase family enzyme